jgi:hypothetical protein
MAWNGEAWGSGIVVWIARDEVEHLAEWVNDAHTQDPDGFPGYFSRTEDGGYRA